MPAKDIFHDAVKNALIKDGWTITHDPLRLSWGGKDMYVDLGAEKLLAAEKEGKKIAVEVKSFVSDSDVADLEKAVGQYVVYESVLSEREPERELFLAVPQKILQEVFEHPLGQLIMQKKHVQVLGFDPKTEVITRWMR